MTEEIIEEQAGKEKSPRPRRKTTRSKKKRWKRK